MTKILIVEDQGLYQQIYRTILGGEGWKIIPALDGEEGLRLAEEHEPDVILLDLMMPKMDGIEFLRAFKPKERSTKVIVLSNVDVDEHMQTVMALGAAKYLVKANYFTPKQLIGAVNEVLLAS